MVPKPFWDADIIGLLGALRNRPGLPSISTAITLAKHLMIETLALLPATRARHDDGRPCSPRGRNVSLAPHTSASFPPPVFALVACHTFRLNETARCSLPTNEGIIPGKPGLIRGMEQSMVVNHLGPFLLTHLLLPDLRKASATAAAAPASAIGQEDRERSPENVPGTGPASRIVNVGSRLEKRGNLWAAAVSDGGGHTAVPPGTRWFQPPPGKNHDAFGLYGSSKLCNMLFTFELDRRLEAAAARSRRRRLVTANIVTPGIVNTKLGDGTVSPWVAWAGAPLKAALMRSADKGAETVVWAATSPEVEEIGGGKFFGDKNEVPCSDASKDEDLARQLWEATELAVGLEESERIV
ncbi:unnamed protein product [Ectocarpus fasciculatus]